MRRCYGCMKEYSKEYDICPHCGYIVDTEPENKCHLFPGTVLAERYILGKVIGHGGFGITYIAWDNKLQKTVAIKEYFPNAFSSRSVGETQVSCYNTKSETFFKEGITKMLDEARRLSKFAKNENIVDIYDFFEENNTAYIVMEYLDGKDLKKYLEENGEKLSPEKAVEIILPVLNALEDLHKEKLIHRDVSPDNIYLCDNGKVKLLDFGSARLAIEDSEKSMSVMVKHGYAPKEQYASRSMQGPWTDVYAVCATLYKAITGTLPSESLEREAKPLKPLESFGIENRQGLQSVIFKGLEPEMKDRYQDVESLRYDLENGKSSDIFAESLDKEKTLVFKNSNIEKNTVIMAPVSDEDEEKTQKPPKPNKKHIIAIAISIGAVAAVIAIVFAVLKFSDNKTLKVATSGDASAATPTDTIDERVEWKIKYEEKIQELIDAGYCINAAYVDDVNSDGVPTVALSTEFPDKKIANIILNYKNGEFLVLDGIKSSAYNEKCIEEFLFYWGTDFAVHRVIGNHMDTMRASKQTIYSVSEENGKTAYKVISETKDILSDEDWKVVKDLEKEEAEEDYSDSYAENEYFYLYKDKHQEKIKKAFDAVIEETVADDDTLVINFFDKKADFGELFDADCNERTAEITKSAIKYLNVELGVNLKTSAATLKNIYKPTQTGEAGKDVKWEYYEELGLLEISGTGVITVRVPDEEDDDYYDATAPWSDYATKTVIINEGITGIGARAFAYCENIVNIKIPDTVTSIGNEAFHCCRKVKKIVVPAKIKSLSNGVFSCCSKLENIILPNGLESISGDAFSWTYELEKISIPDTVKSIGEDAFYCSGLTDIILPEGLTKVEPYTFNSAELKSATIPASVKEIGIGAFSCWELTEINYGGSLSQWNAIAVYDDNDVLDEIILNYKGGQKNFGEALKNYTDSGYCGLDGDNIEWFFYADTGTLRLEGGGEMDDYGAGSDPPWEEYKPKIKKIVFRGWINGIGDYAFWECVNLTEVRLPGSMDSIYSSAFSCCYSLKKIEVSEKNDGFVSVDGILYTKDMTCLVKYPEAKSSKNYKVPDTVTRIAAFAFYNSDNLTNITLPSGVTEIGTAAFAYCDNLTTINIPVSVTVIRDKAFKECGSLSTVYYGGSYLDWLVVTLGEENNSLGIGKIKYNS